MCFPDVCVCVFAWHLRRVCCDPSLKDSLQDISMKGLLKDMGTCLEIIFMKFTPDSLVNSHINKQSKQQSWGVNRFLTLYHSP